MIYGFIGDIGQGKTLSMVRTAYSLFKQGHKIYSNIKLNFKFEYFTINDIIKYAENDKTFKNAVFLIDEAHIFIDSRNSMTKKNLIISYFILQTRKKDVTLLYTTQYFHQIDKRLRASTNAIIECYFKKYNNIPICLNIINIIKSNNIIIKKDIFNPIPYFKLYDTLEVVKPI